MKMKYSWRKTVGTVQNHEDKRNNSKDGGEERMVLERNMKNSHPFECATVKKGKRFRSAFTTEQVSYLEKEFRKYPYIGNSRRKDVASVLNIAERAVKIWFQNRRMKEKKEIVTKELESDGKRKVETELRNLFVPKRDRKGISPQLTAAQEINTETLKSKVNSEGAESYLKVNNANTDLSTKAGSSASTNNLSTFNHSDDLSRDSEKTFRPERVVKKTIDTVSVHEGAAMKSFQPPVSKSSDRIGHIKPRVSLSSPNLPEDLSPSRKVAAFEDEPFRRLNPAQEHSSPTFSTSGFDTTTGSPVFVRGFYTQPYMPPGNMIWKPVSVPITSTGMPAEVAPSNYGGMTGPRPESKVDCSCNCHWKPYNSPVVFQPNGSESLMQYIITAVPISGQTPI